MKPTRKGRLDDVVSAVLAEPYIPGEFKVGSYLENWCAPSHRGGMLRRMSESYFIGSLNGHSIDEIETLFNQFIVDAQELGKEAAAERLYLRLMPPTLTNGGPPMDD